MHGVSGHRWVPPKPINLCTKRGTYRVREKQLNIALFSLKTAAKAQTKLQQGKTSINKLFPPQKYPIEKNFQTILQKTDSSGMRGGTFAVFYLNTQTS